MLIRDLVHAMERIAPLEYAEPWDRVGLQIGRPDREIDGPVLMTIDLTERVLAEAIEARASAVIAYHPPIWEPLKTITGATARERILLGAAEAGVAVYVPHTALDAVPGGISDWLCEGISGSTKPGKILGDCRALEPWRAAASPMQKIVTFVPEADLEMVRGALATAGAGRIGAYEVCSFSVGGEGTFMGGEGTNPTVGEAGRFETVRERRLEMVCPAGSVALALETLRQFHPYEEPAVDVYDLAPQPRRRVGVGRRLVLDQETTMGDLAERLRAHLVRSRVRGTLIDAELPVRTIGVVPGAGESLLPVAEREGCDLFITGEMRHHQVLDALHRGVRVLLAGHTNTERGYLPRLGAQLEKRLPGLTTRVAEADVDLLGVM